MAQAGVQLRRLPAQRRDAHRVLQEAARVAVMTLGPRGRQCPQRRPQRSVVEECAHERRKARVGDLPGKELEKAVELVRVAAHRGREGGRVGIGRCLQRPHLQLQGTAEPLDTPEHLHRVALVEAAIQQLDVVPDARLDASAGIDQLEREIRGAVARAPPLLSCDGVDAFDRPVLRELGDAGHGAPSLGRRYARRAWPTSPRFAQFASRIRPHP